MSITFSIDPHSAGTPFAHYWEHCVGSCHAVMGLRADWREQLAKCRRELGFQYIRFHGLLDDAMSVCTRETDVLSGDSGGHQRYSFFNIDRVFDFLLSIGMKPFIELGFMPSALASGTKTCFHYKANITPPADYAQWEALIRALTRHLVGRYGAREVGTWFFEVWNEPNLAFFWAGNQEQYFKLYRHAAAAIKSVDSRLRVGGPATSVNAWIPDLLEFCRTAGVPIDFVSTHHYPTDDPLWRNSNLSMEEFFRQFAHETGKYERGVLRKMAAKARAQAGDLPLYYTEWNSSALLPDSLHDDAYSAALVAKTIADNDGLVEGYSFWTFSDLFEEQGQYAAPFHGGFGLQTVHGIAKPTYRVFQLLHRLGNERIQVTRGAESTVEMLAVRGESGLTLLAYNHDVPGAKIAEEEVVIAIRGLAPVRPIALARIDAHHANPKQAWIDLGSPEYPTQQELARIEQASDTGHDELRAQNSAEGCTVRFSLPAHGVAALTLPL
jgi:xylan 1,4-beta-xylosidase